MSWRLAKSLIKLKAQVDADYPGRPTKSDGARGDAAHASRASDHNEDSAGVVRALDLTEWVQNGIEMNDVLAEQLRAGRDSRIKYVISDGRMFSSYKTSTCGAWQWRTYSGVNAHTQHVHISVVAGAHADDTHAWAVGRRLPERASRDLRVEDDVAPEDIEKIAQRVATLLGQGPTRMKLADRIDRSYRLEKKIADKLGVPATEVE